MKVLMINTLYAPFKVGGAEVSVQALAEGLVEQGHEVHVICLHNHDKEKRKTINRVTVIYLPLANIYWPYNGKKRNFLKKFIWNVIDTYNFVMAQRVQQLVKELCPDVVHTNNLKGFSVAVWRWIAKLKIRIVHTSRDYYLFHANSTLFSGGVNQSVSDFSVLLGSWVKKRESKFVHVYVGISKFITKLHTKNGFFGNAKSKTIFNSVKNNVSLKTVEPKIVVGFMGYLSASKGFDVFVKMAKTFNSRDMEFIAAGNEATDYKSSKLIQKANENKIGLLGFVPLIEFLARTDVVVMPVKWNEPFGRVAIEAALCGKLVLVNPCGGLKELAEIVPNIHILDTSTFLDDVKNKYPIKQDSKSWRKKFSVEKIVNDYCAVYFIV